MSGQSTYLSVLLHELKRWVQEQRNSFQLHCLTPEREQQHQINNIFSQVPVLSATLRAHNLEELPLVYELTFSKDANAKRVRKTVCLVLYHNNGEIYSFPATMMTEAPYVFDAHALILMADPLSMLGVLEHISFNILSDQQYIFMRDNRWSAARILAIAAWLSKNFFSARLNRIPIAIALSKSDILKTIHKEGKPYSFLSKQNRVNVNIQDLRTIDAEVRELINQFGDQLLLKIAEDLNTHFFAVSATGHVPSGDLYPKIEPRHCLDPLLWILHQLKEQAQLVIGADGMRSLVARAVQAPTSHTKPSLSCSYYTYWSGVPIEGVEIYSRPSRLIIAFPTNDGLTCTYVSWPQAEFHTFRADIERHFLQTLDLVPSLAERVRQGKREARFAGTGDAPNFFRKPFGPGWVLVGDAGCHEDPYLAQGITNAFHDAALAAEAIDAGFSERQSLETALSNYERQRNATRLPLYELNAQLASLEPPPPEIQHLLAALQGNQTDTNRFFGVLDGSVAVADFFAPDKVAHIIAQSHSAVA